MVEFVDKKSVELSIRIVMEIDSIRLGETRYYAVFLNSFTFLCSWVQVSYKNSNAMRIPNS